MKFDYTEPDIARALENIGVGKDDDVFLHSNLGFFGRLDGCKSADDLCEAFLRAIRTVIGGNGTIVTPTFSYSYCHNEIYDPNTTKTACGILSEYMIRNYPENRTLDPNFSVCGYGPHMNEYKQCDIHETFGTNSFWTAFRKNNGKILCLNFDAGSVFIHYIERQNNVPYRYNKAFNGQTLLNGELTRDYAVHFVYDGASDAPCMERVDELCRKNGISKQINLGRGTILAFSCNEYFDFFSDLLKKRPRVLCMAEDIL